MKRMDSSTQTFAKPESKAVKKQNYWLLQHNFTWVVAVMLSILITACGGDSSTGPDPEQPPPNSGQPVSYAQDIQPIFNGNCAVSGCHDSGTQRNGVDLSSYNSATNSVGARYDTLIILPDNPSASPIVDKISNDNPEFGDRMPLNRAPLENAEIDSIRAWIEDGAPDN